MYALVPSSSSLVGFAALVALSVVLWPIWKLVRPFILPSPLDVIPGPPRSSIWSGNINDLFNRHAAPFHARCVEAYGSGGVFKFHGPLGAKALYVFDPKALSTIVLKEQHIYEEPEWFLKSYHLVFGTSLVSTTGAHHRRQRKLLNPVFHISHMRALAPLFYSVTHRLRNAVASQIEHNGAEVNIVEWTGRVALELIGQGGLGYSFDPLTSHSRNVYGEALKDLHPTLGRAHLYRRLVPYVMPFVPSWARGVAAKYVPIKSIRRVCEISKAMDGYSKEIFYRKREKLEKGEEATVQDVSSGRDVLSILMRENMKAQAEDRLSDEELLGQISLLVFAATDTTSNALARTFSLLAERQDVQDRLRTEILEASPGDTEIPYDVLVGLPYLDAVCRETLRLYSPVSSVMREAREDTYLPLSKPIVTTSGEVLTSILVPKGTNVYVAIHACNTNPELWGEDAKEWKPERWLNALPGSVVEARVPGVYSNLMTFLGGGRACIGFKFSQLEMKVVLAVMLRCFRFSLGEKEIYWNMASVNYPTVGRDSTKPALYLKVERLDA